MKCKTWARTHANKQEPSLEGMSYFFRQLEGLNQQDHNRGE